MSVIVYRDGVMAADTRAFLDRYSASPGAKAKIRRLDDGTLLGVSTPTPGVGEVMMDWYAAGERWDDSELKPEDFVMLVVKPDGRALIYLDSVHPTGPIEAGFFAIGSGSNYAIGAMCMGADAVTAVDVACANDPFTGKPVMTLTHEAKA